MGFSANENGIRSGFELAKMRKFLKVVNKYPF